MLVHRCRRAQHAGRSLHRASGLPQAPYPLRGEARDVIDDVRRLGGFGIVAHPDSAKPALRWHDWDAAVRRDGMAQRRHRMARRAARTPGARARAVSVPAGRNARVAARSSGRHAAAMGRADAETPVVALAGADAHARAGGMDDDAQRVSRGWFLQIPSYDASFRTFAMRVTLDRPLGERRGRGRRANDRRRCRQGACTRRSMRSHRRRRSNFRHAGQRPGNRTGDADVARTNAPTGGMIVLRKDGRIVAQHPLAGADVRARQGRAPIASRCICRMRPGNPPIPWIVSNPDLCPAGRVGNAGSLSPVPSDDHTEAFRAGLARRERRRLDCRRSRRRTIRRDRWSSRSVSADGERAGQYAALGIGVGKALTERTHLAVCARRRRGRCASRFKPASRNRAIAGSDRSTLIHEIARRHRPVRRNDAGRLERRAFDPALADTLLFVVDTTQHRARDGRGASRFTTCAWNDDLTRDQNLRHRGVAASRR